MKELHDYHRYTTKAEVDRAFHTLDGILKGINIDNEINSSEIERLKNWCGAHYDSIVRAPFNEVIPFILAITDDDRISQSEYDDLVWLCNNIITPNNYYDAVTSDIQRLEGVLHGILSDGVITADELQGLKAWINGREGMTGAYPYDEIRTLIYKVLDDNKVSTEEQDLLKVYFSQFVDVSETKLSTDEIAKLRNDIHLPAICTMNPLIDFKDHLFCFTGISPRGDRKMIVEKIQAMNGNYNDTLTKETNYLVIGDKNNPCWAFSCYGRKVEKAIQMRKENIPIQIVKEGDFWNAAG
jgi:NAD-dependent DNA ligase (contains BRCT domain type II)